MKRIIVLLLIVVFTMTIASCGENNSKNAPTTDTDTVDNVQPDIQKFGEFDIETFIVCYHDPDSLPDYWKASVIRTREDFQEYVDRVNSSFDFYANNWVFNYPTPENLRYCLPALNEYMDSILLVESFDEAFFAENDLVLLTIWISGNVSCFELDEVKQIDDEWFFDICRVINSGTEGIIYKSAAIVVNKERGIQEDKITVNLTDRF